MKRKLIRRVLCYLVVTLSLNSGGSVLAQHTAEAIKNAELPQLTADDATRRGVKTADRPLANFVHFSAHTARYPLPAAKSYAFVKIGANFDNLNFDKFKGEKIKLMKVLEWGNRQATLGFGLSRFRLSLRSRGFRFQINF